MTDHHADPNVVKPSTNALMTKRGAKLEISNLQFTQFHDKHVQHCILFGGLFCLQPLI